MKCQKGRENPGTSKSRNCQPFLAGQGNLVLPNWWLTQTEKIIPSETQNYDMTFVWERPGETVA
jgi:hypothetical protein